MTFIKTKKYARQMTLMSFKYQFLKKKNVAQNIRLNTLSDIMIMILMLLDRLKLGIKLPQMTGYARKFEGNT